MILVMKCEDDHYKTGTIYNLKIYNFDNKHWLTEMKTGKFFVLTKLEIWNYRVLLKMILVMKWKTIIIKQLWSTTWKITILTIKIEWHKCTLLGQLF